MKLCENRFRTIPNISFFDVGKKHVVNNPAFFSVFARFLRSYVNSDVTSRFLAIFCFRLTDYEVCTIENRQNTCVSDFVFPFFVATGGTSHDKYWKPRLHVLYARVVSCTVQVAEMHHIVEARAWQMLSRH